MPQINTTQMPSNHLFSFDNNISDFLFGKLCQFVRKEYGIVLNDSKRALVLNRINRRVGKLDFKTIDEYLTFVFSDAGAIERRDLGGILSTNETYFFREEAHMNFLAAHVKNVGQNTNLKIWSAGCSSGEEVFTIAMTILESRLQVPYHVGYTIKGTDISSEVLMKAQTLEFTKDRFWATSLYHKEKYFKRSCRPNKETYLLDSKLIQNVSFDLFNLVKDTPDPSEKFDLIFCRNVIIYFDSETRAKVVQKLYDQLNPGGFLFLGMTEGSVGSALKLPQLEPSIFQKR